MGTDNSSVYYTGSAMSSADANAAFIIALVGLLLYIAIAILMIVATVRIYHKANKPGWAAIIPIYRYVVLLEIVGRPLWWIILIFIPLVNIYVAFVVAVDLAKSFGKSTGFGIGNFLLPIITYPILAFSKNARYLGPIAHGLESFAPAPGYAVARPQTTAEGQPIAPTMNNAPQPHETPNNPAQPRPPQS